MEKLIQINDISYSYPQSEKLLLNKISFSISLREWICLRGPSGSGKSTLARIIAGHLAPQSGRILLNNQNVTLRPGKKIILIHQEDDLFPWLNVERQVRMANPELTEGEVKQLIALVKLDSFNKHYPNQLSGGMKKRLSLARALACKPKLIILDESLSSLDMELRLSLAQELVDIWKHTATSILQITHQENEFDFLTSKNIEIDSSGSVKETKS